MIIMTIVSAMDNEYYFFFSRGSVALLQNSQEVPTSIPRIESIGGRYGIRIEKAGTGRSRESVKMPASQFSLTGMNVDMRIYPLSTFFDDSIDTYLFHWDGSNDGLRVYQDHTDSHKIAIHNGTNTFKTTALIQDTWNQISFSISASRMDLVTNGVAGAGVNSPTLPTSMGTFVYLGGKADAQGNECNCYISDLMVSNISRTTALMISRQNSTNYPVDDNSNYYIPFTNKYY